MRVTVSAKYAPREDVTKVIAFMRKALGQGYDVFISGGGSCSSGEEESIQFEVRALPTRIIGESDPELNLSGCSIKSAPEGMGALQGCVTGYAIDPLEAAIESTTRVMRDERDRLVDLPLTGLTAEFQTATLHRLADHLDELLALQIKQLSARTEDADLISKIQAMAAEVRANAEAMKQWASGVPVTTSPIGDNRTRR